MNLKHLKHFNCKYPIICAGMNQVSGVKLALPVKKAGCYPSFVSINHVSSRPPNSPYKEFGFDPKEMEKHLNYYYEQGGDRHYIMGVTSEVLMTSHELIDVLIRHKPAYLELFDMEFMQNHIFLSMLKILQNNNIKILLKILDSQKYFGVRTFLNDHPREDVSDTLIDGVVIKSSKAAGRVAKHEVDLIWEVQQLRAVNSNLIIVAQGGISKSQDIIDLQAAGADIVSIGTLFAVTEESPISVETKLKMVNAEYNDTQRIGSANQNAIVFSKMDKDSENNTRGLRLGLNSGTHGHVYAGAAIDTITSIRTVQQVVDDLTKGL